MKREDAVSLLRRIMATCMSFNTAQAVAISQDKVTKSWILSVNWTPQPIDNGCLDKILVEYGLEAVTTNERTVFRSRQESL
jgi:hypothetical protein